MWTGTLTLDVLPIPDKQYLIVRWENRWEHSNHRIFDKANRGTEDADDDSYRHNWFDRSLQSDRISQQQPSFETFAWLTGGLAADG